MDKPTFGVTNKEYYLYWRAEYLKLSDKTDILCDIILNEYPENDDKYIIASKIQKELEAISPQEGGQ